MTREETLELLRAGRLKQSPPGSTRRGRTASSSPGRKREHSQLGPLLVPHQRRPTWRPW
jgi:hypothetical protein